MSLGFSVHNTAIIMTLPPRISLLLLHFAVLFCLDIASAFGGPLHPSRRVMAVVALATSSDNNGGGDQSLVNHLATLDRKWQIQQRSKPQSRWTTIYVNEHNELDETAPSSSYSHSHSHKKVYLLEPPNKTIPSCIIVFYGGAGLGQFPQIAYNELLVRISNRLNAAILAAPYPLGLDHFGLAKNVGELARQAIEYCQEDPTRLYPSSIPVYCLAHSLGCKLAAIHVAATSPDYRGMGFMSFNNFGFAKAIDMAKQFADAIGGIVETPNPFSELRKGDRTREILNTVFQFAETAVTAIGIEFQPAPQDMERIMELKFDEERRRKVRMFVFDEDKLDSSQEIWTACQGSGPSVSGLPGTHLTPVYFKIGLDQMPEEARGMAKEAMGGFESASFGNEEELNTLVNEICDWILGKNPSRGPKWMQEVPQIAGVAADVDEQQP